METNLFVLSESAQDALRAAGATLNEMIVGRCVPAVGDLISPAGAPLALRVSQRLLKQQGPGEAQWFLFLELAPMPVQG